MKYTKEQISNYRRQTKNKLLKKLPNGFYDEMENQKVLLQVYIEEECNNSREIFLTKTSTDLKNAGLAGLLYHHKGGMVTLIANVFGESYACPWELQTHPIIAGKAIREDTMPILLLNGFLKNISTK
jgi:hypothetical protein